MFFVAMKDGVADTNPVREVKLNTQRVRYLTDEEEKNLHEAIGRRNGRWLPSPFWT